MNPYKVINKTWTTEHFVDADKYTRVSKSQTFCGLKGKNIWQPDAVFFQADKKCKKCIKKIKELNKKSGNNG